MNKDELQIKIHDLQKEVKCIWNESADMENGWNYYCTHPKLKELINLEREYALVQDYILEDLDDNGDLMTLEEFVDGCLIGPLFTDSDGFGYYATETQSSDIHIHPSDIVAGKYRKDFTHVIWYNK